jgi:hypothetical protein
MNAEIFLEQKNYFTNEEQFEIIVSHMEEYAKLMAVEFSAWKDARHSICDADGNQMELEELYDLFLAEIEQRQKIDRLNIKL